MQSVDIGERDLSDLPGTEPRPDVAIDPLPVGLRGSLLWLGLLGEVAVAQIVDCRRGASLAHNYSCSP
jgi:hypothetical protein